MYESSGHADDLAKSWGSWGALLSADELTLFDGDDWCDSQVGEMVRMNKNCKKESLCIIRTVIDDVTCVSDGQQ